MVMKTVTAILTIIYLLHLIVYAIKKYNRLKQQQS